MDALKTSAGLEEQIRPAGVEAQPAVRSGLLGRWVLLLGSIALVCVMACHNIGKGEFDYYIDEAQHAVTGLFVADFLRDLPLRHPVQYAYLYYAQYPAVAILHWPPLFYLFEGLSFLLLGPSVVSARLTVIFFSVVLLYQWFLLVEELQDSYTAAISTAVLGLLPMVLLFEKTVMLEIPSLALCVGAIRHWIRYLDQGRRSSLYYFGLWLSAALMCKQTSVYLLVFCALTLLVTRKWKRIFSRDALAVGALVAVLAGPFLVLMLFMQGKAVANDLGSHRMSGWEQIFYYAETLPSSFSVMLLVLAALGLLLAWRWNRRGQTSLMVCWILAGYLTFSWFGQKEARFAIYWFPPLVYLAVGLLTQFFRGSSLRMTMRGVAAALVVLLAVPAWSQQRPYISGYKDVASHLVNQYHAGIVLFDGPVPGNFVFFMRALDPARHFLVLRKVLYADDIRPGKNSEQLLHSREDLTDAFRRDGIRFIVVSENLAIRFDSQRILRDQLHGDQFQLLERFPISSNEASWKGEQLQVYENKQWTPPSEKVLRIRMLTLPHDIVVPFEQFEVSHP
ncbi:MAG TPA: glycosyltransferase family 39 protein [Candidatus Sulfotelmatobacter sp.]|nr:glycosyltransferase family 39 protein [Candidatus Sulfotelmatobacter sp.]